MKAVIIIITAVVFLFVPLGIDEVYGYHEILSVSTDKEIYSKGESIVVTIVTDWDYNEELSISIEKHPPPDHGNIWTTSVTSQGKIIKLTIDSSSIPIGKYNMVAGYTNHLVDSEGNVTIDEWISNEFRGTPFTIEGEPENPQSVKTIDLNGGKIDYQIIGGEIIRVETMQSLNTIQFMIQQDESGSITIALPREIIDSKLGGEDMKFNLSFEDENSIPKYTEKTNDDFRILTIQLPDEFWIYLNIQGTTMNDFSMETQTTKNLEGQPNLTDSTVSIEDLSDLIEYDITGGGLLGIFPDVNANSLIVSINSLPYTGELTITIPRTILDSKINGVDDDEFFVLIDGYEGIFHETKSSSERTLTINLPMGAEKIEIIGTYVIPEFGSIAMLILTISVIAVIVSSRKFHVIK